MRIALLCATRRGYLFLKKLMDLAPQAQLTVFSFREEPCEPPFLDSIRELTLAHGGDFVEDRFVGSPRSAPVWDRTVLELVLVVSWRYLIPPRIYLGPRLGTFVFHDSMLPAYRGFSPTVWAIINGEEHTGVTLFAISENVDDGDIVDQQRVAIGPDDGIADVMDRATRVYLELLERNLPNLLKGSVPLRPQAHEKATYTCKRLPEDNQIDWSQPAHRIHNLVRAVTFPYSGAYTYIAGQRLRVWSTQVIANQRHYVGSIPGRIIEVPKGENGSVVMTGDGPLLLTRVQLEGQDIASAAKTLNKISHTLGK